jgi:hypothetical protein
VQGGTTDWDDVAPALLSFMQEPTYKTVLRNRPLLFVLDLPIWVSSHFGGSWSAAHTAFDQLRTDAQTAGLGNPYLAAMSLFNLSAAVQGVDELGFDAISNYAVAGFDATEHPYSDLASLAAGDWDTQRATGKKVIPLAMAGWDPRPRIDNGSTVYGSSSFYLQPTPSALGAHVQDAIGWAKSWPSVVQPDTLVIYNWSENAEGGWLVPTLSEGTARLDALARLHGDPMAATDTEDDQRLHGHRGPEGAGGVSQVSSRSV